MAMVLFRLVGDGQFGGVQAALQFLRDPGGKGHAVW
jgi:hypothetical protein